LFFFSFTFYGQEVHHQMISSQGAAVILPSGLIINQTIGQQSSIGNSIRKNNIVMQGFQQNLWSKYISTNSGDSIITKTYPNPFVETINFKFSQSIIKAIKIYVYDTSGRIVFEDTKNANDTVLSVDLSNLPGSQYLVHLYTQSFNYYTQIIKL